MITFLQDSRGLKKMKIIYLKIIELTLAVTICPSVSIRSIVPVGKYGRINRKDLTRYLKKTNILYILLDGLYVH